MIYRSTFILLFLLFSISTRAQSGTENVGVGQWRLHLPFSNGIGIAEGKGKVYCATRYGMFSYTKDDGAIERLSRINGLSDFNVSTLDYNPSLNILVLAYDNSNIDLVLSDNSIYNIPDISRKNIVGNKNINDITFVGNFAYLSCGFGIVQLDLKKKEIKDTWIIGPNGSNLNVNGLAFDGTWFYAATNSGIYKAMASDPNIFNYTAWNKDATLPFPNGQYNSVTWFANKIFTVNNDSLPNYDNILQYDGTAWTYFSPNHFGSSRVDSYKDHMVIKNFFTAEAYNTSLARTHVVSTSGYSNPKPNAGLVDDQDIMWIADNNNGLVRFDPAGSYQVIRPDGPASTAVFAMDAAGTDLWVASGSRTGTSADYATNGAHWFSGTSWKTFDRTNDPKYASLTNSTDLVNVLVDPKDTKHAFMGTWGSGLMEYGTTGITRIWDTTNSTLMPLNVPGFHPVQIGGEAYDSDGNLWVATCLNSKPLSMFSTAGVWQSFAMPSPMNSNFVYNLLIDGYDQKWMVLRGVGIGVWYQNDINNPNDNSFKFLNNTLGNGNLPSLSILSIAEDKDHTIWIGSDKGVAVIYNPYNVLSGGGDFDAQKIIVTEGGYAQYLLESEQVTAIAVDGANRKWFGTVSSGAYLQSADGTQKILNFNTDNSPLLSNNILSIAISDATGEVFFGTDKGIISYRGTATEGGETCSDAPTAFPNPVKHDYHGPIAINGLVANADVKITDIAGNVVHETKALGGQAVWDGNNYDGKRAHSGVYMIFASNEDGTETCVTKLLFIN